MSGLFGSNSTVTSKTSLPKWIESFAKEGLEQADTVASELTPPYQGERVQGLNDTQENALDAAGGAIGRNSAMYGQAADGARGVMGYNPQQVQGKDFLSGDINGYMSPYTQNVENEALRVLDEQRMRSINQTGDAAAAAGAFGGSRHGVMEGVVNAEAAKGAGALSAGLRDQAFKQGQSMMTTDMNRSLAADTANMQSGLQGQQLNLQGAGYLGDIATADQNAFLQGTQASLAAGNQRQAQDQLGLASEQQLYNEMRGYPLEQLDIRMNALGMTPYGSSSSQTSPNTSNPAMGIMGGALAGSQLAGMLGYGSGVGAMGGAALGLLSDEREKEDIEELGKDPETGIEMHAYRYKGDPKSYPKVVGPMAQDVEKRNPSAVREIGGKKIIGGAMPHNSPVPVRTVDRGINHRIRSLGFGG